MRKAFVLWLCLLAAAASAESWTLNGQPVNGAVSANGVFRTVFNVSEGFNDLELYVRVHAGPAPVVGTVSSYDWWIEVQTRDSYGNLVWKRYYLPDIPQDNTGSCSVNGQSLGSLGKISTFSISRFLRPGLNEIVCTTDFYADDWFRDHRGYGELKWRASWLCSGCYYVPRPLFEAKIIDHSRDVKWLGQKSGTYNYVPSDWASPSLSDSSWYWSPLPATDNSASVRLHQWLWHKPFHWLCHSHDYSWDPNDGCGATVTFFRKWLFTEAPADSWLRVSSATVPECYANGQRVSLEPNIDETWTWRGRAPLATGQNLIACRIAPTGDTGNIFDASLVKAGRLSVSASAKGVEGKPLPVEISVTDSLPSEKPVTVFVELFDSGLVASAEDAFTLSGSASRTVTLDALPQGEYALKITVIDESSRLSFEADAVAVVEPAAPVPIIPLVTPFQPDAGGTAGTGSGALPAAGLAAAGAAALGAALLLRGPGPAVFSGPRARLAKFSARLDGIGSEFASWYSARQAEFRAWEAANAAKKAEADAKRALERLRAILFGPSVSIVQWPPVGIGAPVSVGAWEAFLSGTASALSDRVSRIVNAGQDFLAGLTYRFEHLVTNFEKEGRYMAERALKDPFGFMAGQIQNIQRMQSPLPQVLKDPAGMLYAAAGLFEEYVENPMHVYEKHGVAGVLGYLSPDLATFGAKRALHGHRAKVIPEAFEVGMEMPILYSRRPGEPDRAYSGTLRYFARKVETVTKDPLGFLSRVFRRDDSA
jgi:hypothetical protein